MDCTCEQMRFADKDMRKRYHYHMQQVKVWHGVYNDMKSDGWKVLAKQNMHDNLKNALRIREYPWPS